MWKYLISKYPMEMVFAIKIVRFVPCFRILFTSMTERFAYSYFLKYYFLIFYTWIFD